MQLTINGIAHEPGSSARWLQAVRHGGRVRSFAKIPDKLPADLQTAEAARKTAWCILHGQPALVTGDHPIS